MNSETPASIADDSPRLASAGENRLRLSTRKKLAYALVALLLLTAVVEGVGQVLYGLRSRGNRYLAQAYYRNREWSADLWRVQDGLKLRYEPYVGWRRADVASAYVNIVDGERRTVHPAEASPDALRVWCFGGSTMWGTGVRDAATTASRLAALAQADGFDVAVRNFGESGWVSTQEAVFLGLMLRAGERPDVVLFYDGVNDVFSAFQSGKADGAHQNLGIFEDYFNLGYDPRRTWLTKSAIYRGVQSLGAKLGGADRPRAAGVDFGRLAERVAAVYFQNVDGVQRLAESYGFEALFFWQPVVSHQPGFQTAERDGCGHLKKDALEPLLQFYDAATAHVVGHEAVDLTRCLGPSPPEGYFIDHHHVTEEANAVIARAIYQHLRGGLEAAQRRRAAVGRALGDGTRR